MTTIDTQKDIHQYMGLSYANYLVMPRTLLQSMPEEWQHKFVALLDELDGAFNHVDQAAGYEVKAGEYELVTDMDQDTLAKTGWTVKYGEEEKFYYSPDGHEYTYGEANGVYVFVRGEDPVPHYNRGRTYIEPANVSKLNA